FYEQDDGMFGEQRLDAAAHGGVERHGVSWLWNVFNDSPDAGFSSRLKRVRSLARTRVSRRCGQNLGFRRDGSREADALPALGPVQELERAVGMFHERRAVLDPI